MKTIEQLKDNLRYWNRELKKARRKMRKGLGNSDYLYAKEQLNWARKDIEDHERKQYVWEFAIRKKQ